MGVGIPLFLFTSISSSWALLSGIVLALTWGNPFAQYTQKATPRLLAIAIVGLGCGMNLSVVARVGLEGLGYTIAGISLTFLLGTLLGKALRIEKDTSLLISTGTAICGGSAIAAVASAIRPKDHEVTVALATVFCLNALGLLIFPYVGRLLGLDENQFGLWSALAIHDTSSVVGATYQYGDLALKVGTTVKLARALWIVPLTFLIGMVRAHKSTVGKLKKPWFILGFLIAAALMTFFPSLNSYGHLIESIAKRLMVLTLFFIGANLSSQTLTRVGIRPFIMGVVLWGVVATSVLAAISWEIIR
ncbi:MAG: putative sulfate exporter family transporter [Proteobacteria bacterium]|nr:putative sulfate exporter family transporter [Pseudomonadota bacterium]